MQNETPLVSVLMTAYNREKYIGEAIASVLTSTYTNFELIIVDDVSTDNTVNIAKCFERNDSRVKLFINEKNLGDYANRNKAALYATGKYLKFLDSDDKLFGFSLEYCVKQMEKNSGAALGLLYLYKDVANEESFCWNSEKIIRSHFFNRSCLSIGPSGSIIRRDKFEEIGGFDTRFGVVSDNFFNIKMASHYPVVLLPKAFLFYREHEGQERNNQIGYLKFGYLYFKELVEKIPLPLLENEVRYLSKKKDKRFAVNLTQYLIKTKDLKTVQKIMSETGFNFTDIVSGYFK